MPARKPTPQAEPSPLLLSARKAADFVGVGRTKLLALRAAGQIKAKVIDGKRYYLTTSPQQFVESLPDA